MGTLTLSPERQSKSVRISKITNDGLTSSVGTRCFIAVPIRQQWASKGCDLEVDTYAIVNCSRRTLSLARSSSCLSFHVCVSHTGFLHLNARVISIAWWTDCWNVRDLPRLCQQPPTPPPQTHFNS